MRIIAGEYGGRRLKALEGSTTRPTTDRVKESLMSALVSARGGFEGALVFDAFAGSGALGLEALSRGAAHVVFYERNAAAFRILRTNVESLQLPAHSFALFQGDCLKQRPRFAERPFDLVFLDPPYDTDVDEIVSFLKALYQDGIIGSSTLISYEHAKKSDSRLSKALNSLQCELISHRNYGDTSIEIIGILDGVGNN